jgi:hypothetical protein
MKRPSRTTYKNGIVYRVQNKRVALTQKDGHFNLEMTKTLPENIANESCSKEVFKRNGKVRITAVAISRETMELIVDSYLLLIAREQGHDINDIASTSIYWETKPALPLKFTNNDKEKATT